MALAAPLELEMLHRVGDVDARAVDPGLRDGAVEHLAGGADERPSREILLVARLLADEHQRGVDRSFAEHCLRRMLVQVAARAARRLVTQRLPRHRAVAPYPVPRLC